MIRHSGYSDDHLPGSKIPGFLFYENRERINKDQENKRKKKDQEQRPGSQGKDREEKREQKERRKI